MASRESSASEGEIVEATNKANTVPSRSPEPGIDNSSRGLGLDGTSDVNGKSSRTRKSSWRLSAPDYYYHGRTRTSSRSPSPYRRNRDRSPSPFRHSRNRNRSGSRTRSPSPFRHDRDNRGRDVKYSHPNKRKASPHRNGRPEKRYQSNRDKYLSRRQAPHENGRTGTHQPGSYKDRDFGSDKHAGSRNFYSGSERRERTLGLNEESTRDGSTAQSGQNGDQRHGVALNVPASTKLSDKAHSTTSTDVEMTSPVQEEPDYTSLTTDTEKVPSQESREEKKRRWAAMRAQHAATGNNLLQQAVLANASETTTPNIGSPAAPIDDSVSPGGSPRSPAMDSAPASPDVMVIDKQEGVGEGVSPPADDPSAANYDPTQDMLDDRVRAEQKAHQPSMSASAYDETNPKLLSALPAEKSGPAKRKKKEIDMFAFSDDEDEEEDEEEETEVKQSGPVKGTVLDAKLLDNWDDADGYYKIISNELVNAGRYRMVKGLGRGVFANVAQAEDVKDSGKLVAIKIVRRNDAMKKSSQKEMDFLRRLNDADPQDKRHIIRLLGSFDHKGHLCIVFEHMSKNLRDLLKEETSGHGLSLQAVKTYARQMFSGLKHLQDCQIIHADLKPDNILVSMDKKTVKLCDLGTAADKRDNNEPTPYLVSRFYRAPEIILEMDIGYAIDMWAIGCTIFELWTGKILFPGRSNNQMIKVFMECLGWPSEKLLKKGQRSGDHFEAGPPLKFKSREVDRFGKVSKTPFVDCCGLTTY